MARLQLWNEDLAVEGHDYDPEWDYPVIPIRPDARPNIVETAVSVLERDLLPAMEIAKAVVFSVEDGGLDGRLGLYVNGTAATPFIGIDVGLLRRKTGSDQEFYDEILLTIVHELGHAYLDRRGVEENGENPDCEAAVEAFARAYLETGRIDLSAIDSMTLSVAFRE